MTLLLWIGLTDNSETDADIDKVQQLDHTIERITDLQQKDNWGLIKSLHQIITISLQMKKVFAKVVPMHWLTLQYW